MRLQIGKTSLADEKGLEETEGKREHQQREARDDQQHHDRPVHRDTMDLVAARR